MHFDRKVLDINLDIFFYTSKSSGAIRVDYTLTCNLMVNLSFQECKSTDIYRPLNVEIVNCLHKDSDHMDHLLLLAQLLENFSFEF